MEGQVFYAQDVSLFLYQVRQLSKVQDAAIALDVTKLPTREKLPLLDPSEAYVLHAKVDVFDGNSQELRERASRQLFAVRDALQSEVELLAPDRLALDTKIQVPRRRD